MARAEIDSPEIGQRLQALRKKLGLDVKDVASAVGLKPFALREKEEGRAMRHYLKLAELARVLGTTPNHILGVESPPQTNEDRLALMGAALEAMLVAEEGWALEKAREYVEIATQAALEEDIEGVDQRLAVRSIAVSRARQRVPRK